MTKIFSGQTSLVEHIWPAQLPGERLLRLFVMAVLGSVALAVSAKMQVPFYPVPMTLQLLVLLLIAASFGKVHALATILLYMAEGALGLPVFAGTPERGIGIAYMVGPTGGYLLGFVLLTIFVGSMAQSRHASRLSFMIPVMLSGVIIMYIPGLLYLGSLVGFDERVWAWGFTPFILADCVKAVIAGLAFPYLQRIVAKI